MIAPGLLLLLAAVCTIRLLAAARRPVEQRLESLAHGLMALVAAGKYDPHLVLPIPPRAWVATFTALAAAFLVALARSPHARTKDVARVGRRDAGLACLAMVFLLLPPGEDEGLSSRLFSLGLVLVLVVGAASAAVVAWTSGREFLARTTVPDSWRLISGPVMPAACHTLMTCAMAPLLLTARGSL